jgi:predicted nucleotidyltransferase component of viral defense system
MTSKAMSLKARIRNLAKEKNIAAQVVLQNYMFERLLERISLSKHKNKFILKGGILIAAIVGLDTRSTMDLDAILKSYPLDEEHIRMVLGEICAIKLEDDVSFKIASVAAIRKGDVYGGYRVGIEAVYDEMVTPLSVDISTGDAITPHEVLYLFKTIFDDGKQIELWAYNIETVLAEKIETILRRGAFSTRPRDFYDVYILSRTQNYDKVLFGKALNATVKHRETAKQLVHIPAIIETIRSSEFLRSQWQKYQSEYFYAKEIKYEDVVDAVKDLVDGHEATIEALEEYALYFEAEKRMKNAEKKGFVKSEQVLSDLGITESDLDDIEVDID